MAKMLISLSRSQIDSDAWDACVEDSSQRIVYGYSWYLDAVLPAPFWKWIGFVLPGETGQYKAVLPVPLRRKQLAGITYEWIVHQPFFCQFLAVFSRDPELDPTRFFETLQQQFRYGSILTVRQQLPNLALINPSRVLSTHILNLSVDYETIYQHYTPDRKANLRRALRSGWTVITATDPTILLSLFRENHAHTIPGGVAEWAYVMFTNLIIELNQRGLVTLRHAVRNGRVEAGALFVQEGNRIIYLFNAASEVGRKANARTLLIDQMICENAGSYCEGKPMIFDFESPEKSSIRKFYQSFGAVEEPFWSIRWSRLTWPEQIALRLRKIVKKGDRS